MGKNDGIPGSGFEMVLAFGPLSRRDRTNGFLNARLDDAFGYISGAYRSRFVTSCAKSSRNNVRSKTSAGALALVALIAFGVSGCGRRGPLEPPPDPSAVAKPDDDPAHPQIHRKPRPIVPPKAPFVLDPLL
jgi:predicted small lipoprotein YifL